MFQYGRGCFSVEQSSISEAGTRSQERRGGKVRFYVLCLVEALMPWAVHSCSARSNEQTTMSTRLHKILIRDDE
jgi:hypothetical protein